jgi:pimeloyl-ACP methyl ester carboxylesterase
MESIQVNINDFTIDDVIDFSDITGIEFDEFAAHVGDDTGGMVAALGTARMLKALKAVVYLNNRRTDPAYTLGDAGGIKLSDLSGFDLVAPPVNPSNGDASKPEA